MSRQDQDAELSLRWSDPTQEDRLAQQMRTPSIPRSIVSTVTTFDMSPFIREFSGQYVELGKQSNLISKMGAFRWLFDKRHKLEFVKSMIRYNTYVRTSLIEKHNLNMCVHNVTFISIKRKLLAHMRLLSSETKELKSRVVNKTEQVLCRESAEVVHHAIEVQKTMDKQIQTRRRHDKQK